LSQPKVALLLDAIAQILRHGKKPLLLKSHVHREIFFILTAMDPLNEGVGLGDRLIAL
jgi:hypothetical protein